MTQRRPRYATRRDENQAQIIDELRMIPGFQVWDVSMLSDEQCPGDILVLDCASVRGRAEKSAMINSPLRGPLRGTLRGTLRGKNKYK